MHKPFQASFLLFLTMTLVLLLSSCASSKGIPMSAVDALEVQTFPLIGPGPWTIEGRNGTRIHLPKGIFPAGTPARILLLEAYDLGDIVRAGLSTQSTEGLLMSSGMVRVSARNSTTGAELPALLPWTLEMPRRYPDLPGSLYRGIDDAGTVIWEPVPVDFRVGQELADDFFGTSVLDNAVPERTPYEFSLKDWGWYNVDWKYRPAQTARLSVVQGKNLNQVLVIAPARRVVMRAWLWYEADTEQRLDLAQFGLGEDLVVIGVGDVAPGSSRIYYSMQEAKAADGMTLALAAGALVEKSEFAKILADLD